MIPGPSLSPPSDDARDGRSTLAARTRTTREYGRHVVERAHELNLELSRRSVDRGVTSQLIPGGAEHLKRLLERFESVGDCHVTTRLLHGRPESLRGFEELRCWRGDGV